MKIKSIVLLFTVLLIAISGIALTACDNTIEQLSTESGIVIDGGGFEKGASITAEKVEISSEKGETVIQAISQSSYDKTKAVLIFDISVSKDGSEIQPNGSVEVTIPVDAPPVDGFKYSILHVKDDNTVEALSVTYTEGKIKFSTSGFSCFVLVQVAETSDFALTIGQLGADGFIKINDLTAVSYKSQPYSANVNATTSITVVATLKNDQYAFDGWFEVDSTTPTGVVLKETAISTNATYSFTMPESQYALYAVFSAPVSALSLDGASAGFSGTTTTFTIGDTAIPTPDSVVVSGLTADGNVNLTLTTDYTVDDGGLNLETAGTYVITYTYKKNNTIKATLTVEVVAASKRLSYSGSTEESRLYNGGWAALVRKDLIENNGVACDWDDLGLSYEWRKLNAEGDGYQVVETARDETRHGSDMYFPSPAVVGTYNFVIYDVDEKGKVDLLTIERTITQSGFTLATTENGLEEMGTVIDLIQAYNYAFIAKVGEKYYAMATPLEDSDAGECDAIEVFPNVDGVINLGDNYEYVFSPYDSGKNTHAPLEEYYFKTGEGASNRGNIILWNDGRIQFTDNTSSADNTILVTFDDDAVVVRKSTADASSQLRLVYDSTSGKYFFTSKTREGFTPDTRTSYPVYLYTDYAQEITPPSPSGNTYELNVKLGKVWDGSPITVDMLKQISINDGKTSWADFTEESATIAWYLLEGKDPITTGISYNAETGIATGPSDIGSYRFVIIEYSKDGKPFEAFSVSFDITNNVM